MKNVAHYQSESQTMNTTTCLILITATLLAAAKGFEVGSFDNNYYYEEPAPTSKVILVSCDTLVTLNIESKIQKSKIVQGVNSWFLRFTPDPQGRCERAVAVDLPEDRSMYSWRRAGLPAAMSSVGQQFVIITPEEFEDGGWLWVGSQ